MADSEVQVTIVNGASQTISGLAVQSSGAGTPIASEVAIRVNSALASSSNNFPVADAAAITNLGSILSTDTAILSNATLSLVALNSLITNQGRVSSLAYTLSSSGTVGVGSGTLLAAGAVVQSLVVQTLIGSTSNVFLNPTGGAATVNSGIQVYGGGGSVVFGPGGYPVPTGAITAITDGTGSQVVTLVGG